MTMQTSSFAVIDGSLKKEQKLFQRLLDAPHIFSSEEFDHLLERFQDRLDRSDRYELLVRRARHKDYGNALEKKALLAVLEGRLEEAERFRRLLERRNELNIKVLSGEPKAPPR